jgi:hypothetical protein
VQFVAEKLSEQDLARGFCREIGVTRSDPSSRDATRALRELESQLDAAGRRHARVHGELRAVGGGIRVVGSHGSQGSRRFERSLIRCTSAANEKPSELLAASSRRGTFWSARRRSRRAFEPFHPNSRKSQ